jgi:hypothetical protein
MEGSDNGIMEELRKTTTDLSQDGYYCGQDLSQAPPEYRSRAVSQH